MQAISITVVDQTKCPKPQIKVDDRWEILRSKFSVDGDTICSVTHYYYIIPVKILATRISFLNTIFKSTLVNII